MAWQLATLHPKMDARFHRENPGFFTRREREQQIRKFYRSRQRIPLCLEHECASDLGLVLEEGEAIGRVVDLFNGRDGRMLAKLQLDQDHPAYKQIKQGMFLKRERWGVSVGIVTNHKTLEKQLVHVALTNRPYFAEQNTFLHHEALDEPALDLAIARRYYRQGEGECYASGPLKRKMRGALASLAGLRPG